MSLDRLNSNSSKATTVFNGGFSTVGTFSGSHNMNHKSTVSTTSHAKQN